MVTTPVASNLQNQAVAAPTQKIERNVRKDGDVSRQSAGKALTLPEDIVTLSSVQPSAKKPSQPVSNEEKSALLDTRYTFSIYG